MNPIKASAKVRADVRVSPTRSQVFLVAASIVAGIGLISGAMLLMANQQSGWGFVVFAAVVLAACFWAWQQSQSDTDWQQAHATELMLPDGTHVITDSRILKSPIGLRGLINVIQEMLTRQHLPEPDGLVDVSGNVIPDSTADAISLTNKINSETQSATNSLIDRLGLADGNQESASNINVMQHLDASDNCPDEEMVQDLNIPMPQSDRT